MEWLRIGFWTRLRKLFSILTLEVRRLAPARGGGIWWISEVAERKLARSEVGAEESRGEETFEVRGRRRGIPRRGNLRGPGSPPRNPAERRLSRSGVGAEESRGEETCEVPDRRRGIPRRGDFRGPGSAPRDF